MRKILGLATRIANGKKAIRKTEHPQKKRQTASERRQKISDRCRATLERERDAYAKRAEESGTREAELRSAHMTESDKWQSFSMPEQVCRIEAENEVEAVSKRLRGTELEKEERLREGKDESFTELREMRRKLEETQQSADKKSQGSSKRKKTSVN
jgi:hypothetical protein